MTCRHLFLLGARHLVVLILLQKNFINHTKGFCIWYDQCTTGDKSLNCFYNEPAKNLTDPEGVQILNSLCPELRGQHTCCSTEQLVALDENLQTMLELTNRCPACWNNIRRLYCQLTCSQDQSLFTNPNLVIPVSEGREAVVGVEYFVSPRFKQGLFERLFWGYEVNAYDIVRWGGGTIRKV